MTIWLYTMFYMEEEGIYMKYYRTEQESCNDMVNEIENNGEIIIYQSEDGKIKLDVRLENKTVWLTQEQIATLFSKGRTTITEHISNIFKEGELDREKVCRKIRHTTQHGALEGKTQSQEVTLYNLDVIISVGYRIRIFRLCGNSGSQTSPDVYGRLRKAVG